MGILSVLAAAAAAFVFGAIWYMALARPWLRATGIPLDEKGNPAEEGGYGPFIVGAIALILVAGMMRHIFTMSGIAGAGLGSLAGFGIGAFLVTPWVAMNYAYAQRSKVLTVIDGLYAIIGCTIMGLVLTLV